MARLAGITVFLGGLKADKGTAVIADGVMEEFALAQAVGSFILPIGAFGGAAEQIAKQLSGSIAPSDGPKATRPKDDEITALLNPSATERQLIATVRAILDRLAKVT
jgi:hypothetical protein